MISIQRAKWKHKARGEKGIALLMCIFALLLLTGLALALMFMSDTEQAINNNYRDSERAYFAAMAGLQEARTRMRRPATTQPLPAWVPTTMPTTAANTGVTYLLNSDGTTAVQPWNFVATNQFRDDQICNESFPLLLTASLGPNLPCVSFPGGNYYQTVNSTSPGTNTTAAMDYKWIRITRKANASAAPYLVSNAVAATSNQPICWDGSQQVPLAGAAECELVEPVPPLSKTYTTVYRLTSFAMAPGRTQRTLQMDVAERPPIMTNAAVDSQDHVTLNGKLDVNGFDYCSCDLSDMTKCTKDAAGVTTCPGLTMPDGSKKTCNNKNWAIYASSTVDNPNKSETLVAGPNPPVVENQPWLYDIPKMIDELKSTATDVRKAPYNWTCTSATSTSNGSCGTHSGQIYGTPPLFPPSPPENPAADSTYGACSNGIGPGCPNPQVTYVPGNVQLTGGSVGNGILIVDGDLDIHGGLQFYGLILVRGVVKFTGGGSDKTNIYGAVLAGQESYVDNVLGGSATIQFNICALKQSMNPQPPTTISFHELAY